MTEQTIEELANYIVSEIEREDFVYAIKHYGCYKIKKTVKELKAWCDEVDGRLDEKVN